jgi:hypothetical protein
MNGADGRDGGVPTEPEVLTAAVFKIFEEAERTYRRSQAGGHHYGTTFRDMPQRYRAADPFWQPVWISRRKGACLYLFHRAAHHRLNREQTERSELAINILEKFWPEGVVCGEQFAERTTVNRGRSGEPRCQSLIAVGPKRDGKSMER